MLNRISSFSRVLKSFTVLACLAFTGSVPAHAEVVRNDFPTLMEGLPHTRIYEWRDPEVKPRAVAIACHGLIMHGATYDVMARDLAAKGFIVVAADMRGYGRWCKTTKNEDSATDQKGGKNTIAQPALVLVDEVRDNGSVVSDFDLFQEAEQADKPDSTAYATTVEVRNKAHLPEVMYERSYKDLKQLVNVTKDTYPSLPLFIIGESLGAGMALHVAADMPGCIDGIVLSSPAIKRRLTVEPAMMKDVVFDAASVLANPKKEVDLIPYMKRLASNDQNIIEALVNDPLIRKKLTVRDLLKSAWLVRENIKHARRVPDSIPVLIIQGDQDRIMRSNGVVALIKNMKTNDQTVKWFKGKGHLLLETPHALPETLATVSGWLMEHANGSSSNIVRAEIHDNFEEQSN